MEQVAQKDQRTPKVLSRPTLIIKQAKRPLNLNDQQFPLKITQVTHLNHSPLFSQPPSRRRAPGRINFQGTL